VVLQDGTMYSRTALVVTPDLAELDRWAQWLEAAGFLTVACAGPRLRTSCPRLDGERCMLRDAVDVAVVAMASGSNPGDEHPEASCTTSPDDGTTVFVEGSGILGAPNDAPQHITALSKHALVQAVEHVLSRGRRSAGQKGQSGSRRTQFAS
jgi:hypothetical protein